MIEALDIRVKGVVQGVGFRPFVYRLAKKYLINGWVLNAADGVFIHAEGEAKLLDEFVLELSENPPAAAQVTEIELKEVPLEEFDTFEIRYSDAGEVAKTTLVSPDLATCDDCAAELFDPADRRYHYPFINCTNCGPRFTIINGLPYDRKSTSMADFPLCPACAAEYGDALDRRFHAQPNACFTCGPHVAWRVVDGSEVLFGKTREQSDAIFAQAVAFLQAGKILAVKGLGGFHLVCDAQNAEAVARLRTRKRREGKPFAVMLKDEDAVKRYCEVNETEGALLTGSVRPIVLLRKREGVRLVTGLADGLTELGVMLPYTPIQHMLLHGFDGMLVMTSGNLHDEPIVTDDEEAYTVLGNVADAFLGHNRDIVARYDDSVVRVLSFGEGRGVQMIRRARGYAPRPLAMPGNSSPLLATGPEQKNTFCLVRDDEAFVSQHMGDMESAATFDAWLEAERRYERLFGIKPQSLACDLHPEYLTSKWAHEQDMPCIEVQHHHAHIVAVMAENGLDGPVLGMAFDGTGYGVDGAIWGGEVLLCNHVTFERFANFAYVPMPGGAAAIKHPLRMAYGILWAFDLLDHPYAAQALAGLGKTAELCGQMIEKGLNTPYTSSVGRLFDAASALLGVCIEPLYEGEGAVLLESSISNQKRACDSEDATSGYGDEDNAYDIELMKNTATAQSTARDTSVIVLDAAPVFKALLDDAAAGVPAPLIARRFHDAFVRTIVRVAQLVRATYDIRTIALSGGVFMNRYLAERGIEALIEDGFSVAVNRDLPPNDGCVSFGQAVVAWANRQEHEEGT